MGALDRSIVATDLRYPSLDSVQPISVRGGVLERVVIAVNADFLEDLAIVKRNGAIDRRQS